MAAMMKTLRLSLASKSAEIRNALEPYMPWIRACMADDGASLIQLRFDYPLAAMAAHPLIGAHCRTPIPTKGRTALEARLQRVEFPPAILPAVKIQRISRSRTSQDWFAEWLDCPVALYFSGLCGPVVAMNVPCVDGAAHNSEWREVTLVKQEDVPALLDLMKAAYGVTRPLKVMGEASVMIQPLEWDDLVLDDSVIRLVRDDFHLFLEREEWYRQHRLPFRCGYLLYGPPGNGKSSVIRAMLSTAGISGFTINPFRTFTDDDLLAGMFAEAAQSTPSIVVLEDLDRWFPANKAEESGCQISLPQLLNLLDGVRNQDGIIVAATANHPEVLDTAILRRPGRFDRMVEFGNPSKLMRASYWRKMCPALSEEAVEICARASEGFSFAEMRESYILAGQTALEAAREVTSTEITNAMQGLRAGMKKAERKSACSSAPHRGFHPHLP
jgi:SpoVK/Ycf46/Vps4 family AAA+-type ATPase